MLSTKQTHRLIEDCWQQVFRLRRSLAELKKVNAQGWKFLDHALEFPPQADAMRPQYTDPIIWRKRAEEARFLADITDDAEAKRSLLEIAGTYDALASSGDISNRDTAQT